MLRCADRHVLWLHGIINNNTQYSAFRGNDVLLKIGRYNDDLKYGVKKVYNLQCRALTTPFMVLFFLSCIN